MPDVPLKWVRLSGPGIKKIFDRGNKESCRTRNAILRAHVYKDHITTSFGTFRLSDRKHIANPKISFEFISENKTEEIKNAM